MRNILTWVVALLLLSIPTFAQTMDINQPGLTIQQINSAIQANLTPADTGEGSKADLASYFNTFWSSRVYYNDSTLTDTTGYNMFAKYYSALNNAITACKKQCGILRGLRRTALCSRQGHWYEYGCRVDGGQIYLFIFLY